MVEKKIRTIVLDVDGTLTDGRIHIGQEGELFKSFYCRDGLGIISALSAGIDVVILTSRKSSIVDCRARELGITVVMQGAAEKKEDYLMQYMKEHNLCKDEVAYMGDDINDLESMRNCGIIGCPADAVKEVKQIANFISNYNGGNGAVRQFIDWLIRN